MNNSPSICRPASFLSSLTASPCVGANALLRRRLPSGPRPTSTRTCQRPSCRSRMLFPFAAVSTSFRHVVMPSSVSCSSRSRRRAPRVRRRATAACRGGTGSCWEQNRLRCDLDEGSVPQSGARADAQALLAAPVAVSTRSDVIQEQRSRGGPSTIAHCRVITGACAVSRHGAACPAHGFRVGSRELARARSARGTALARA